MIARRVPRRAASGAVPTSSANAAPTKGRGPNRSVAHSMPSDGGWDAV